MAPQVEIVKFQTVHPDPDNLQGKLHHANGDVSQGFVRGKNIEKDFIINVYTRNKKKTWKGTIGEQFTDTYGIGWFFSVTNSKYEPDPTSTPLEVLVTVVNPAEPTLPSNELLASPQPQDVP